MTDESKRRAFAIGMDKLGKAFGVQISPERIEVYWERLERYDTAKLSKALEKSLDNESFFPAIAAIRKYIEPLDDGRMARMKSTPVTER